MKLIVAPTLAKLAPGAQARYERAADGQHDQARVR